MNGFQDIGNFSWGSQGYSLNSFGKVFEPLHQNRVVKDERLCNRLKSIVLYGLMCFIDVFDYMAAK